MKQDPIRVLTIDDEPALRSGLAAYLEDYGYTPIEAGNGSEGLRCFREQQPQVVLCDINMPGMSGLDVLAALHKEAPETPVIMISGVGEINDVVSALRLGAWDYITKPIADFSVLKHALDKSLERARLLKENQLYRETLEKTNRELTQSLQQLSEEQEAGRRIQFSLLPMDGQYFQEIHFTRALLPSTFLSGDFVDYFELNAGCVGFYIADVSGHGASSALVTVLLKALMNQVISRHKTEGEHLALEPEQLLLYLNKELLSVGLGKYFTIVYGVLDLTSRQLKYAIGGHYPRPLLWTKEKVEFLPGSGFPIGLFAEATFKVESCQLPVEFKLLLLSDGVFEVIPAPTLAEKEKWLTAFSAKTPPTIEALAKVLDLEQLKERPDDITFLMLERETS